MFWKKKKAESDSVVWRDKTGKITCPGGDCPNDCDNNCPIWLNTSGLQMLLQGRPQQSIDLFHRAIAIAPDFADAMNNLATAYGNNGQHEKAFEYFEKALAAKDNYESAILGLIISAKKLGKYDEALKYCDAYDKLPGCNADKLRKDIPKSDSTGNQTPLPSSSWMLLAEKLLQMGRDRGYIQSTGFPQIPELLIQAESIYQKILNAEANYQKEHPEENYDGWYFTVLSWSAYAGMGAVYHWNEDWNALSKAGIYETLTKERGFIAMDEYVFDTIGIPFGSSEYHEFSKFRIEMQVECENHLDARNLDTFLDTLLCGAKAMYAFGMVFEMNRLGMK